MSVVVLERQILHLTNKVVRYSNGDHGNINDQNTIEDILIMYNELCCSILFDNKKSENIKEFMFSVVYRLIYFTNDLANTIAITKNI